jgi:glycosyl transferase family 25
MTIKNIIEDLPILYINLNRAIDRKNKIEEILNNNNLEYKRIEAIDGLELDYTELKKQYNFRKITKNEVACALSHIKAIQYAFDNNYEYTLIMEDDCSFEYLEYKNIPLKDLMTELTKTNSDWEIIQLGIICDKNLHNTFIDLFSKNKFIKSCYYSIGAVAYLINKKGMDKILNYFSKTKNLKVADEYVYQLTKTYITMPYFTQYANIFKSDIRDDTSLQFQNESKELWDTIIKN